MQSTRERVLQTLLKNQRCTINELANAVEINPISVRHHIAKLQSESLVDSIEQRHGVGRPRRLYFLTDEGLEQFPTRYIQMSNRLLSQIKRQMSDDDVRRLFSQMAESLVQEEAENQDFTQLPLEERLKIVSRILINEGFTVEWEKVGDEYHLRETNCPYLQVGQHHPEVCAIDQTLISTVLAVPAEKVKCILDGDAVCTYIVPTNITVEN